MVRLAVLSLVLSAGVIAAGQAQSPTPISVEHAWARATPGNIRTGGVYLTIVDHGPGDDRLVAVSTPVAGKAEVHEMHEDKGVMVMRPVGGIAVAPGQSVELKPGGYHVMLMELKQPLKEGDNFPLTLTFEKAGPIQVSVTVEKPGARGPMPPAMPGMKMPDTKTPDTKMPDTKMPGMKM